MVTWEETVTRFFTAVKNLAEFDKGKIHGVLGGQLNLGERERYLYAVYLRAHGNINSFLKLDQRRDFQASIMIARAVFELALDIKLLECRIIENDLEKIKVFTLVDRLKAANKLLDYKAKHSGVEIESQVQEKFIREKGPFIVADQTRLWPDKHGRPRQIQHWSGSNLQDRVKLVGGSFERWYAELYSQFSWHTHAGFSGVSNVTLEGLTLSQGLGFFLALESYSEVLRIVIRQFRLSAVLPDISEHLSSARLISMMSLDDEATEA